MDEKEKHSLLDILRGNIEVMTWTRFMLFFPSGMFGPYFPLFVTAFGGSPEDIGFVQSMASVAALIIVAS